MCMMFHYYKRCFEKPCKGLEIIKGPRYINGYATIKKIKRIKISTRQHKYTHLYDDTHTLDDLLRNRSPFLSSLFTPLDTVPVALCPMTFSSNYPIGFIDTLKLSGCKGLWSHAIACITNWLIGLFGHLLK